MPDMRLFVAGKVIVAYEGKILLIRESPSYREGTQTGKFDVAGGRIDPGEGFKQGVIREVKEETGLDVALGAPLFVSDIEQVINGERCQVIRIYFEGSSQTGDVTLSPDHSEFKWIDPRDYGSYPIIGNMAPAFEAYLARACPSAPARAAERIAVVDADDNVIGSDTLEEVDRKGLTYRAASLWVKDPRGDILLARRAYTKSHDPGKWGPAAVGTVRAGESYRQTVIREAKEEIGLDVTDMREGPKAEKNESGHHFFVARFVCMADRPVDGFALQRDEVAEVRWFSRAGLERELKRSPQDFLVGVLEMFDLFG